MNTLLRRLSLAVAVLLGSCSHPQMEDIAQRVQQVRLDNALYATQARIRVWKDTSVYDKHGWHLHSAQENTFTLPRNEFQTVRYLILTQGYTSWRRLSNAPIELNGTAPGHIVELEWLNRDGRVIGGVNIVGICRESQLSELMPIDFPLVLPDDAYQKFFALPSIGRAMDLIKK